MKRGEPLALGKEKRKEKMGGGREGGFWLRCFVFQYPKNRQPKQTMNLHRTSGFTPTLLTQREKRVEREEGLRTVRCITVRHQKNRTPSRDRHRWCGRQARRETRSTMSKGRGKRKTNEREEGPNHRLIHVHPNSANTPVVSPRKNG